jgi:DnaK suppressor protein
MRPASEPERLLRERAAALDELLGRLGRDEQEVRADRADGTADDEHDPEGSTLSGEWQRLDAVLRATLAERAEVDAALRRVADGAYGLCVRCGQRIPAARLVARPMATMCVACASRESRG